MNALARAWRLLTWRHWAWATGVAVGVSLSLPLQDYSSNHYWFGPRLLYHTPWFILIGYLFVVAIAIVESTAPAAVRVATWRYVVAMVAATSVSVGIVAALPQFVRSAPREVLAGQILAPSHFADTRARMVSRRTTVAMGFLPGILHAWLATLIYAGLRNSRRATRALADAEIERNQAHRDLLAAQLIAAHARVDPAFVLRSLEGVERAYETDAKFAERLLDEFIEFLRDAIPRLRADGTPVTPREG